MSTTIAIIIIYITIIALALLAHFLSLKRAEKFKNKKVVANTIATTMFFLFIILFHIDAINYINILVPQRTLVDLLRIYILLLAASIYIETILITDDLIKNVNILISIFKK